MYLPPYCSEEFRDVVFGVIWAKAPVSKYQLEKGKTISSGTRTLKSFIQVCGRIWPTIVILAHISSMTLVFVNLAFWIIGKSIATIKSRVTTVVTSEIISWYAMRTTARATFSELMSMTWWVMCCYKSCRRERVRFQWFLENVINLIQWNWIMERRQRGKRQLHGGETRKVSAKAIEKSMRFFSFIHRTSNGQQLITMGFEVLGKFSNYSRSFLHQLLLIFEMYFTSLQSMVQDTLKSQPNIICSVCQQADWSRHVKNVTWGTVFPLKLPQEGHFPCSLKIQVFKKMLSCCNTKQCLLTNRANEIHH